MNREEMCHATYKRLLQYFPEKPWQEAISKLGSNPPIHRLGENFISYGLYLCDAKKFDEYDDYDRNAVADAILYSGRLMDFYEELNDNKKNTFKARWEAAFYVANDMRALTFEMFVHDTLQISGWSVESKDDSTSGETYDYLASRKDELVQVECKSFAYDKGLLINASEASSLASEILNKCSVKNRIPNNELCIVTVNICQKLPKNPGAISKVSAEICEYIDSEQDFIGEKFSVNFQRYNDVFDIQGNISSVLPVTSEGIELQCIVSMPDGNKSRVCLRITTIANNAFWREFEKVCKDAAKNQLKKEKPAILAIHASNIESMTSMLKDKRFPAKKDNIFKHPHIIGIVFISNTGVYEQNEYPYLFVMPHIKEFFNDKSIFKLPEKIFTF